MLAVLLASACVHLPESTGVIELPEAVEAVEAEEPAQIVARATRSGDPGLRARAIAIAIHGGDLAIVGPSLADESEWVRRSAVDALGGVGARDALVAVARDPAADPYLRGRAAVLAGDAGLAAEMHAAARSAPSPWEAAPLALAAVRLGDRSATPLLARAIDSGELPLDVEFARDLGRVAEPSLVPALRHAAERGEPELAPTLAATRLALGDAAAEPELRKLLTSGDEDAMLEVIDHAAELEPALAAPLLRRAGDAGSVTVARYAEIVLAATGGGDSGAFVRAVAGDDRELRVLALQLSVRANVEDRRVRRDVQRAVEVGLADVDSRARSAACRAAGQLRLTDLAPLLRARLVDEVEMVRLEAAGALLEWSDRGE